MILQPVLGILHHRYYIKHKTRGLFSYLHIGYGYTLILIGLVEGGLGLRLSGSSGGHIVAYAVTVGVICLLYAFIRRYIVAWRQRVAKLHSRLSAGNDALMEMQP